jgi:hypothetical protein
LRRINAQLSTSRFKEAAEGAKPFVDLVYMDCVQLRGSSYDEYYESQRVNRELRVVDVFRRRFEPFLAQEMLDWFAWATVIT